MDVDVDLNAKYAIMCHKTVLILDNDEESLIIATVLAERAERVTNLICLHNTYAAVGHIYIF